MTKGIVWDGNYAMDLNVVIPMKISLTPKLKKRLRRWPGKNPTRSFGQR
jgi:hypothetical protein